MQNEIIFRIVGDMKNSLTYYQLNRLKESLIENLSDLQLVAPPGRKDIPIILDENNNLLGMFLSAKQVEGCSERTITYYRSIISRLFSLVRKSIREISTDDIRSYLAEYKDETNCSGTTIDNVRRIFSSFFAWLEDENYIIKSPVRRIHRVKTQISIKETFTDENLVTMKDNCGNIRNLALLEFLISTGVRVGEVVRLKRNDIDFENRSCVVLGKGNRQREVYFDAKTKIHLEEYLETRHDNNDGLFVSMRAPYGDLSISGVELIVRNIGKISNIGSAYPHKFRRTLATMAIDKGMSIEQVQKLLGHVKIETTMHYAMVSQNNVRMSHRKYIG